MTATLPPGTAGDDVDRAVLYLRGVGPAGVDERQRRALAGLRIAARRREFDVEADVWERAPATTEVAPDDVPVSALLVRFQRWAARADRSLAPGFDGLEDAGVEDVGEAGDDRSLAGTDPDAARSVVGLPLLAVALYDADGEVLAVYPHADGDATRSVEDCIDALATPAAATAAER